MGRCAPRSELIPEGSVVVVSGALNTGFGFSCFPQSVYWRDLMVHDRGQGGNLYRRVKSNGGAHESGGRSKSCM